MAKRIMKKEEFKEELYIDDRPKKISRGMPCTQESINYFIRTGDYEAARQMVEYNDMLSSRKIGVSRKTAKAANG